MLNTSTVSVFVESSAEPFPRQKTTKITVAGGVEWAVLDLPPEVYSNTVSGPGRRSPEQCLCSATCSRASVTPHGLTVDPTKLERLFSLGQCFKRPTLQTANTQSFTHPVRPVPTYLGTLQSLDLTHTRRRLGSPKPTPCVQKKGTEKVCTGVRNQPFEPRTHNKPTLVSSLVG